MGLSVFRRRMRTETIKLKYFKDNFKKLRQTFHNENTLSVASEFVPSLMKLIIIK